MNMETKELMVAKAKTVIIATGGAGRMHYQGFPTSNHYGATADGLVLGYRAGAKLLYADTLQYHPTGAAYPQQIFGALVTEKVRSLGAKLVNRDGKVFMHPLETRDVAAASIIRECSDHAEGVDTGSGLAVWLDTPMIEQIGGEGTIEKRIPAMMRMFMSYGIDIRKEPILVYPTLHYQNGGLDINVNGMTTNVENLFVDTLEEVAEPRQLYGQLAFGYYRIRKKCGNKCGCGSKEYQCRRADFGAYFKI